MAIENQYLSNNIHFKPLCARLGRGVLWTSTTLQQHASETEWHGRVVHILSKAVLLSGALVCVPIALIEAVALFIIGGLGIAINFFACQNQSEFLQKYSLKSLSYALHSAIITLGFCFLGIKNPDMRYHTANAIFDYGAYLGTAGFTQFVFGSVLDKAAGRDPRLAVQRTLNLLSDTHPDLILDVFNQMQRDFNINNFREGLREIPHLENYLNRHPNDRQFIQEFNFQTFLADPVYRERAAAFLRGFLAEGELIPPQANGANPLRFELNQNTEGERAYQDRLARHLKTSFLEIYRTPELSQYLNKAPHQGKDLLVMLDASICVPLTVYTQYKELLEPIQCPAEFSDNLAQYNSRLVNQKRYNSRLEDLIAAKMKIDALSPDQKTDLVRKILQGGDFQIVGPVQDAYLAISLLAQPFIEVL